MCRAPPCRNPVLWNYNFIVLCLSREGRGGAGCWGGVAGLAREGARGEGGREEGEREGETREHETFYPSTRSSVQNKHVKLVASGHIDSIPPFFLPSRRSLSYSLTFIMQPGWSGGSTPHTVKGLRRTFKRPARIPDLHGHDWYSGRVDGIGPEP